MCWEKKFCLQLITSQLRPAPKWIKSLLLNLPELFDSATHWKPLCEASSGSQALFFMEQIDGHSCRLEVIPVERQRTLSQPHTSWNWNLAVWVHLCCALFDQDVKLICVISQPGGAMHCDSKGLLQPAPVLVVMWQRTPPLPPKSRGRTWAKLRKSKDIVKVCCQQTTLIYS